MLTDKNAERFKGFAEIYNSARPACPEYVVKILSRYLGDNKPNTVVDIGCGTGLSTQIWRNYASTVKGIEPSDDMRNIAESTSKEYDNIEYIKAFSNNTGLKDDTAAIITCSQSFHWMEPTATLKEVNRLLKNGGIFAAYDCDWPPVCSPMVDMAYEKLMNRVRNIEHENDNYKDLYVKYPKENHLNNINKSGYFRYAREIVFTNSEMADANRYFNIAISQGGLQEIIKQNNKTVEDDLIEFKQTINSYFAKKTMAIYFCYRMRLGVK